jgi:hypothetical protein
MANTMPTAPTGPVTEEAFLADRIRFWDAVTKFMTRVAGALVVLLILLWYFLV